MPGSSVPPEGSRGKQLGSVDRIMTRIVTGTHGLLLGATGGRFVGTMGGNEVAILTTIGRKTGRPRSHPVITTKDGSNLLVVATNGGAANHPMWLRNLATNPEVNVKLHGATTSMRAEVLTPDEKRELWPRLVESYDMYDTMQAKTDREIPVVRLSPVT